MSTAVQAAEIIRVGDKFHFERNKTFAFALTTGLKVLPLEPLSKSTLGADQLDASWHPSKYGVWDNDFQIKKLSNYRREDGSEHRGEELNIGVLFCENVLDLDIDSTNKNLIAALNHYLKPLDTPYKWGRESKPYSHLAYVLRDPFDRALYATIIKTLANTPGMRVELRGGEAKSNFFSMMPGSIHEKGELVRWDSGYDPNQTPAPLGDVRDLLVRLRRAAAAALVAEHMVPEGGRHYFFLALIGMLVRMHKQACDAEMPDTAMDQAQALDFMHVVQMLSGDKDNRNESFNSTWRKFMEDPTIPIQGGKALAEKIGGVLGQEVRNHIYRLLIDDEGFEQAEAMLERFVLVRMPSPGYMDLDAVRAHYHVPAPLRPEEMGTLFTAFKVPFGDKNVPLPVFLKHSTQVIRAAGVQLRPDIEDKIFKEVTSEEEHGYDSESYWVNCWAGFMYRFGPFDPLTLHASVEPFLEYIHTVIADGNPERERWILSWLADIFQDPAHKPGTLLALTGAQGSGKTMLGEIIGSVIGYAHYGKIGSIEDLTKEFNSRVHHKLVVQADETGSTQKTSIARDLKELVTGSHCHIVYKGKEAVWSYNPARYLFTSNYSGDALKVEAGYERRYTILEVNAIRSKDVKYWENFVAWWSQGRNLRAIHTFLKNYKYDKNLIRSALNTTEKKLHQMNSLPSAVQWMLERISEGHPLSAAMHQYSYQAYRAEKVTVGKQTRVAPAPSHVDRLQWPNLVDLAAMNEDYHLWARQLGLREKVNPNALSKLLNEVMGLEGRAPTHSVTARRDGVHVRPKLRVFPEKVDLVKGLIKLYPSLAQQFTDMTEDCEEVVMMEAKEEGEF